MIEMIRSAFCFGMALFLVGVAGWQTNACSQSGPTASLQRSPAVSSLEAAIQWASQTGVPMFVSAGQESCAPCKALKQQIQTDETTRQLLKNCILVYLDCDDAAYQKWVAIHPPAEATLPQWFLIRADGRELVNRSGLLTSNDFNVTLSQIIPLAGTALTDSQTESIQALTSKLRDYLEREQAREAAQLVQSSRSILRIAVTSYASSANQLRAQLAQLNAQLLAEIDRARADLDSLNELSDTELGQKIAAIRQQLGSWQKIPSIANSMEQFQHEFTARILELNRD